jgi:hypothetical protein
VTLRVGVGVKPGDVRLLDFKYLHQLHPSIITFTWYAVKSKSLNPLLVTGSFCPYKYANSLDPTKIRQQSSKNNKPRDTQKKKYSRAPRQDSNNPLIPSMA